MKRKLLLITPMLCLVLITGCKKELANVSEEKILNVKILSSNFPTIENPTLEQSSIISSLLAKNDNYSMATKYVDSLLTQRKSLKSSISSLRTTRSSSATTNTSPTDFSNIQVSIYGSSYGQSVNPMYDGLYYDASATPAINVPKFKATHQFGGSLPVRGLYVLVSVPYEYFLKWNKQAGTTYYRFTSGAYPTKVTMQISGAVGTLQNPGGSLDVDDFSWTSEGTQGAHASATAQETRSRTLDVNGNYEISLISKIVGGKTSQGYTITQVQNIQAYFNYDSQFVFWGTSTGYTGSYNDYVLGSNINVFGLLKPVVQTSGQSINYTGPAN